MYNEEHKIPMDDSSVNNPIHRVYESFPDFTGQPVWWTGKICLTNHDFTRPTPYENKQQNKKIVSLNVLWQLSRLNKVLIAANWKNLPDQSWFHQTDTIWEQTTK